MAISSVVKSLGGAGALMGDVMNVYGAKADYNYAREQGNSKAISMAKAAGSFAWGEMFFGGTNSAIAGLGLTGKAALGANIGVMAAYIGLTVAPKLASAAAEHTTQTMSNAYAHRGGIGSGHFDMTEAGYTMRQRSLNAIRQNGLNTQSVLGNEARKFYTQRV